eukprot:2175041-Amphidinium_carterae.1
MCALTGPLASKYPAIRRAISLWVCHANLGSLPTVFTLPALSFQEHQLDRSEPLKSDSKTK